MPRKNIPAKKPSHAIASLPEAIQKAVTAAHDSITRHNTTPPANDEALIEIARTAMDLVDSPNDAALGQKLRMEMDAAKRNLPERGIEHIIETLAKDVITAAEKLRERSPAR